VRVKPEKPIEEQLKESFHDVMKVLVVTALGGFLFLLMYNGKILFYINNRTAWLMIPAATVLFVIAEAFRRRSTGDSYVPDGECAGHTHHRTSWAALLLVTLPVVLGVLIPPQPLGALAMSNRKALSSAPAAHGDSQVALVPGGERNVLDWIVAFQNSADLASFAGQQAHVTGFVYRDEMDAPDEFMVSRFIVTCCVADAVAVGLPVRWPGAETLALDQWVEVSGRFELETMADETIPVIVAAEVVPIEPPGQPYLYPR